MKKIVSVLLLCCCLAATLTGCGEKRKNFKELYEKLETEEWCKIGSDGSYMRLDTNPNDTDNDDFLSGGEYYMYSKPCSEQIKTVNKELGFSDAVYEKMNTTTWSQGKQEEKNDMYKITWTYHPDKGLEVMYEFNDEKK